VDWDRGPVPTALRDPMNSFDRTIERAFGQADPDPPANRRKRLRRSCWLGVACRRLAGRSLRRGVLRRRRGQPFDPAPAFSYARILPVPPYPVIGACRPTRRSRQRPRAFLGSEDTRAEKQTSGGRLRGAVPKQWQSVECTSLASSMRWTAPSCTTQDPAMGRVEPWPVGRAECGGEVRLAGDPLPTLRSFGHGIRGRWQLVMRPLC
jgi:hypothetical protein